MADVARESGVSLSTVSMVFSDKPGLPAETRQRVLKAARNLGYNPRRSPRVNPKGILQTVGLVIKSQFNEIPRSDQFYSQVVAGIEQACRQRHLNLMYATMNTDLDNYPLEIPNLIDNGNADGLLLAGIVVNEKLHKILRQTGRPVVLVDAYSDCCDYDSVISDNENGAFHATQYLIEKGHRKIGFIGGSDNGFPSFTERRRGYRRALLERQIQECVFADCYSRREDAIDAARTLLLEHPDLTALVGANDFIAINAMTAANHLGRRIGEDLSIIGFDDILMSESVIPSLTTMLIDKSAMGRMSVQILLNREEEPESGRITVVLHPRLVERNSVKRIPSEPLPFRADLAESTS
jgi:LacI family transcriptional regulator